MLKKAAAIVVEVAVIGVILDGGAGAAAGVGFGRFGRRRRRRRRREIGDRG